MPMELIQAKLPAAGNIDGDLQNRPLVPQSPLAAIGRPPIPARPVAAPQAADEMDDARRCSRLRVACVQCL